MRTFIAIDISREVRAKLADLQQILASKCTGLRWSDVEQIHLTVQFLGDIPTSQIADISRELREVACAHERFDLRVSGVGAFPSAHSVRVLWVGIVDEADRLASLHRDCRQHLGKLGFEAEKRPFSPHLTLARAKGPRPKESLGKVIQEYAEWGVGSWSVSKMVLYESRLSPNGPTYSAQRSFTLGSP